MWHPQTEPLTTRVRRYATVAMWLVAAGAAAVVGLDPDGLVGS